MKKIRKHKRYEHQTLVVKLTNERDKLISRLNKTAEKTISLRKEIRSYEDAIKWAAKSAKK